jgi:hypothetical protein
MCKVLHIENQGVKTCIFKPLIPKELFLRFSLPLGGVRAILPAGSKLRGGGLMRFCKTLAVVAVVGLAMLGPKVAKADSSLDPKVKLVIPTDPTIEPCSAFADTDIECFTSNSEDSPVIVQGPTLAQLESPGYDLTTDFIYEGSTVLDTLWIAFSPTIPGADYTCELEPGADGQEQAFNTCPSGVGITSGDGTAPAGLEVIEMSCVPPPPGTVGTACTGLLPGEAGSAEVAPEPGELVMLALGIALVGFCGWKRRQLVQLNRDGHQDLAAC